MGKVRLDQLLVERELAETRSKAQAMIMAGVVRDQKGHLFLKPGQMVAEGTEVAIAGGSKYVSRAGEKLASVAGALGLNFAGKAVLDVGSSTGGFSDYALQNGAQRVYAVDVGTGQLAYKLRQDQRVVSMERTDIRGVTELPEKVDIALADVSFISLTKILPGLTGLLVPSGVVAAMVKPQFEAGKEIADRFGGVISDPAVRDEVLRGFESWLAKNGFSVLAAADSKVSGTQGNIERFYLLNPKR